MAQTLEHNEAVTQVVPITLPECDVDVTVIQQLDDEPNDVGGLSAAELKAKFDETNAAMKQYLNNELIPAVVAEDATEQARQEAEAERVANEIERVSNESARASAETGRTSAESGRVSAEQQRQQNETARQDAETGYVAQAAASAQTASAAASAAAGSATAAAGSARDALGYAVTAAGAATEAAGWADDAKAAKNAATGSASAAATSATNAAALASAAAGSAQNATTSESNAYTYQQGAKEYRDETEEMLEDLVKYDNDEFASPLPFNADQLNGHPDSYFAKQEDMSAAEAGIAENRSGILSLRSVAERLGLTKVDKEAGKGLSANDYSNEEKQKVADNTAARHTHANKSILDQITQAMLDLIGTIAGKYVKPNGGIPKTDLAESVQASLGKADSALQQHQSLAAYRTATVQDALDAQKYSASNPPPYPVTSVNGQTGGVVLNYITFDEEEES